MTHNEDKMPKKDYTWVKRLILTMIIAVVGFKIIETLLYELYGVRF